MSTLLKLRPTNTGDIVLAFSLGNRCIQTFHLSELKDISAEVLIAGDFNINLLDMDTRQAFEDFFDSMLSNGFYPSITSPTRLGTNKCSLIDNIYL